MLYAGPGGKAQSGRRKFPGLIPHPSIDIRPGVTADNPASLTVVGIGADGWAGLGGRPSRAVAAAEVVVGSARSSTCSRRRSARSGWPGRRRCCPRCPACSPTTRDAAICVLASGDPMFHGIGATLVRLLGRRPLRVLPHPSSVSLAAPGSAGRWPSVEVVSLVGRPVAALRRLRAARAAGSWCSARGAATPAEVAALLAEARLRRQPGHRAGAARRPGRARSSPGTAADWAHAARRPAERDRDRVRRRPGAVPRGARPARRRVRARRPAHQARGPRGDPRRARARCPGELLWDVGAGAGSIGIEWMRAHPACRAIAVEARPSGPRGSPRTPPRSACPACGWSTGRAPAALAGLPAPDAVFIGGGLTARGVLEALLARAAGRRPAGRQRGDAGVRGGAGRRGTPSSAASWPGSRSAGRAGRRLHRLAAADAGDQLDGDQSDDRPLHRRRARAPPT